MWGFYKFCPASSMKSGKIDYKTMNYEILIWGLKLW